MARLIYGEGGKGILLRATVGIESAFRWDLEILKQRLSAALSLRGYEGRLEVVDVSSYYEVSWWFFLEHTGVPGENKERLQEQAEPILAVFNEMEEKVRAAQVVEEPLSWLREPATRPYNKSSEEELVEACCGGLPDEQEEKGLLEVCCSRPSSVPLEVLKQDLACMKAIG